MSKNTVVQGIVDAFVQAALSREITGSEASNAWQSSIRERFALLDPDADGRRHRYRQFQNQYYPARSAVAHGAKRESLDAAFVRDMAMQA